MEMWWVPESTRTKWRGRSLNTHKTSCQMRTFMMLTPPDHPSLSSSSFLLFGKCFLYASIRQTIKISCQINSLPESEHLCWKWPGLPELDLEAQCRPTTAQLSMLQAWLGNRPSPSEWLKTREAGIPSMWGSTPTPPTCATEGGSMLFVSARVREFP